MDCCNTNKKKLNNSEKLKGGKTTKMERKTLLWIVIGILFLAVLFLTFKVGVGGVAGNVVQSAVAAPSSGGMVGGC